MSFIFGPVPSRRLGRSLGVDLVPFKTCSYDCIYCQLGCTPCKTVERREWVALDDVLAELQPKLALNPDWITLSGSGEPTLYSRIDELMDRIHAMTDVPVAVLTNGSLLWDPDVRAQLMNADLVIPSLDAGSPAVFEAMNRPAPELSFEQMRDGLIRFRQEFKKPIWLEVFFLEGINTDDQSVRDMVESAKQIRPERIQLNTATRPPAEKKALKVSQARLLEIATRFDPPAELIADYHHVHAQTDFVVQKNTLLEMLRRRPCTLDDVAGGLGLHRNEVIKYIEDLKTSGLLEVRETGDQTFYSANPKKEKNEDH
jgi:wyosine [tRNA(Phe)-imidazoG37] synthetase (radical SAM superfamily)